MSLPYEYYSACSKIKDREIFLFSEFEDEMGARDTFNTFDYWNKQVEGVSCGVGNAFNLTLHWLPRKWQRVLCLYFINIYIF